MKIVDEYVTLLSHPDIVENEEEIVKKSDEITDLCECMMHYIITIIIIGIVFFLKE